MYVDDLLSAVKSGQLLAEAKRSLAGQFKMKDMGFLGVKIVLDLEAGSAWIGQPASVILLKYGIQARITTKPIFFRCSSNTEFQHRGDCFRP